MEKEEKNNKIKGELYNIEAEQAIIGAIILNNFYLDTIDDYLKSEWFYEPIHKEIYDYIKNVIKKHNITVDTITLKNFFNTNETLKQLGGIKYIDILTNMATGVLDIYGYVNNIKDLYFKRKIIEINNETTSDIYNNFKKDSSDIMEDIEKKIFDLDFSNELEKKTISLSEASSIAIKNSIITNKKGTTIKGIQTGFKLIDNYLSGFNKSDLIILGARPGMGKTTLALNFALSSAKYFLKENKESNEKLKTVAFFSFEMPAEQISTRLLSMESGVNSRDIIEGRLDQNKTNLILKASETFSQLPFYIDDTADITIDDLKKRVRRLIKNNNLGIVYIDHIGRVSLDKKYSNVTLYQKMTEISWKLKAIAKEFQIPVIAMSQLSRESVKKEKEKNNIFKIPDMPQLEQLRDSGSIEQDADVVMFLHRPQYYLTKKKPLSNDDPLMAEWQKQQSYYFGKAYISIAKNRNGETSSNDICLEYHSSISKFEDKEKIDTTHDEYIKNK